MRLRIIKISLNLQRSQVSMKRLINQTLILFLLFFLKLNGQEIQSNAWKALFSDYSLTSSCYDPIKNGSPCGHCDACILRLKGFQEANALDPLSY